MKKRLLALNLAFVLLLTLVPSVALADGPVVLVPDKDGNASAEYYVNEGSDLTTEFTFIPSKSGVYRLFIEQPQAQPVSGESLALYRRGDNAESISMALNENDVDTRCVLEAGTEYTFSIENNQPGQHLIRLWFIDEAEYVEPVEISSANFPDDVFRQFVASYDINQNGLLEADEFAAINSLYICSSQSFPIQSLNGIEKFIYTKHISIDTDYSVDSDSSIKELPALPNGIESLNIRAGYLEKLPDLSVYTNLRFFNCSCNQITSLPSLPNGLLELDCSGNQITEWPELPDSLYWLDCSSNQLAMFPELPNGLEYLACSFNWLTSLPTLPGGLQELDCSVNQITEWPKLPESLYKLECRGCQLTSLPTLPGGLHELHCSGNQITEWPELPDSLFRLYCSNNQLTMLPDLPNGLEYLDCSYNELTSLPALPDGLQELNCCDNPLAEFPTLPDNLTTIGDWAFSSCSSLTSVTIPDGVTEIGDSAFYDCRSLTSVTVPASLTTVGERAFYGCSSICNVSYKGSSEQWNNIDIGRGNEWFTQTFSGKVDNVEWSYDDGVLTISGTGCILDGPWKTFSDSITRIVIEAGITAICDEAFSDCHGLTSVTIPDGVTEICNSTFSGCSSLTSVTIPDSVTVIHGSAFDGCSSLTSVTIPDSVTEIGSYAFLGCRSLENLKISNSTTEISYGAFAGCRGLTNVTIPDSVTTIGDNAFQHCSGLTSVTIPAEVTTIGWGAFSNCGSLSDVNYLGSSEQWNMIDIEEHNEWLLKTTSGTFSGKNAGESFEWEYKEGVLTVNGNGAITVEDEFGRGPENYSPWSAFTGYITKAVFGDGITALVGRAFEFCDIKSVVFPKTITKIDAAAFVTCDGLEDVYYCGTEAQWNEMEFIDSDFYTALAEATIHYNYDAGQHTHTTETVGYIAPTCTEVGYTGDEVCTVCGETVSTGEVIAAAGHSYGDDNICDDCGHKQSVTETIQTWINDTIQSIRNFFDKIFGRI